MADAEAGEADEAGEAGDVMDLMEAEEAVSPRTLQAASARLQQYTKEEPAGMRGGRLSFLARNSAGLGLWKELHRHFFAALSHFLWISIGC